MACGYCWDCQYPQWCAWWEYQRWSLWGECGCGARLSGNGYSNLHWDPAVGVACCGNYCWCHQQWWVLRARPKFSVSFCGGFNHFRVAHHHLRYCALSSNCFTCILYINVSSMYVMQIKLIKSLSHGYSFRLEWNNPDKIGLWVWTSFGSFWIAHIDCSWAHSPSNLLSNSQIHSQICISALWIFFLAIFWILAKMQSVSQNCNYVYSLPQFVLVLTLHPLENILKKG